MNEWGSCARSSPSLSPHLDNSSLLSRWCYLLGHGSTCINVAGSCHREWVHHNACAPQPLLWVAIEVDGISIATFCEEVFVGVVRGVAGQQSVVA